MGFFFMSERLERKLVHLGNQIYDYAISETGDFVIDESFDSDIIVSLFCDRRADQSEISQPEFRGGWFGDVVTTLQNYQIGSKLWLTYQSRFNQDTETKMQTYVQSCLSWITELGYAQRVQVSVNRQGIEEMIIDIKIYVTEDEVEKFSYKIWKNSDYI
jgi:phage gp46-like protein